jgi:hypothetical protein
LVVGIAELRVAGDADAVVEEAADVLEVLLAIVAKHGATFDEFVAQRCPKVLGVQCTYVGNASCTSRDASASNGEGSGMQAALKWDQGDLVRWWVEDEGGNVLELHDDFSPRAKPMIVS